MDSKAGQKYFIWSQSKLNNNEVCQPVNKHIVVWNAPVLVK